jgi:hypothetical protein
MGKPMFVSREGDDPALEADRLMLERELNWLTEEAEHAMIHHTASTSTHDGRPSPIVSS